MTDELLKILVCPLTKAALVKEGDRLVSTDGKTRKVYPIREGIPMMLVDESEEMEESEWKALMEKHQVEVKGE